MSAPEKTDVPKGWPLVLTLSLLPLGVYLEAVAALQLYVWFAPAGAPLLSLGQVMGLVLLVRYLQPLPTGKERTAPEWYAHAIGLCVVRPLFVLGMGWIVKAVM